MARAQQTDDAVQSSLAPSQFDGRVRRQAEGAQAGDEGKIQTFVAAVVGDVEEGVVPRVSARAWSWSSSSLWRRDAFWHRSR